MKYWLLTSEYPPFYGGGISTYCYFTARMLAEKGHSVTVFVNNSSITDFSVKEEGGIRVVSFLPSRTGSSSFLGHVTNLSYEFAHIVRGFILSEGEPDIIETQEYLGIGYYLLQFKHLGYAWCRNIPVVVTMHSPSFLYLEYNHVPLYKYPNYWIGEMERFCLQAADLVISPSHYILDQVRQRFDLNHPNVAVIPNPYRPAREQHADKSDEGNQVVFYGKLSAQKGTFKLLQYFKQLWDNGFSEPLYLVGGQDIVYHPEGKTMGDLIREQNKELIAKGLLQLEDKIPPSEIAGRIKAARVVIVPSTVDNLPYVVFEMMEQGKVLLVSRQGGQAEVIENGVTGMVFDHDQPQTFGEQLKKVLELSAEEKRKMVQNAFLKLKEQYGFETIYRQKIGAIQWVTEGKGKERKVFPFIRAGQRDERSGCESEGESTLLSVVIPYYNMGKYIGDTLQSVLESTYPTKEIIIVNDGSTDEDSLKQLDKYRTSNYIRILDISNKGLGAARNYGAEIAQGRFLAFLDADDKVDRDYYTKAIAVLTQYANVHFVGCWTQYFEGSSKIWPTFTPEPPIILFHNLVNSSALVYKRSSFLQAGKNDPGMGHQGLEDYDSVLSLLARGKSGVVLPEVLFRYRVRKDSMIRGVSKVKKLYLLQYISKKHKQFYVSFAADIFNLLNANGTGIYLDNPSLDFHLTEKISLNNKLTQTLIRLIKRNRFTRTIAYRFYQLLNK